MLTSYVGQIKSALEAAGFLEAQCQGLVVTRAGFWADLRGRVVMVTYRVPTNIRGADNTLVLRAYYSALSAGRIARQVSVMKVHASGCDFSPGRNSGHLHIWP